jgi:2-polyprenyl-6-methoxyphenol hydroxylase-like FAD-dependent oxidoreductase
MEQVVIAGGGPNGLMLACELKLAGVSPIVLERLPERSTEPRANGLVGQVVRMLDRRGLYERLSGNQSPPTPAPGFVFGALPLNLSVLEENPVYLLPVPQRRIEQVLQERALELGVEIRRGHELTGFDQDAARSRGRTARTSWRPSTSSAPTAATVSPASWPASTSPASRRTTRFPVLPT